MPASMLNPPVRTSAIAENSSSPTVKLTDFQKSPQRSKCSVLEFQKSPCKRWRRRVFIASPPSHLFMIVGGKNEAKKMSSCANRGRPSRDRCPRPAHATLRRARKERAQVGRAHV